MTIKMLTKVWYHLLILSQFCASTILAERDNAFPIIINTWEFIDANIAGKWD